MGGAQITFEKTVCHIKATLRGTNNGKMLKTIFYNALAVTFILTAFAREYLIAYQTLGEVSLKLKVVALIAGLITTLTLFFNGFKVRNP
ncbi:MAG: hypothetical protein JWL81_3466 [Verrucomicrobiales bacterium]|nr:hypothetical protein [Verrucomicrobiales bacterium]